jgi:hypothetical protein
MKANRGRQPPVDLPPRLLGERPAMFYHEEIGYRFGAESRRPVHTCPTRTPGAMPRLTPPPAGTRFPRWEIRMHRCLTACVMAAAGLLLTAAERSDAQEKWSTIKGQIVWGGDKIPDRKTIDVKVDPAHCLSANPTADKAKGTILDEALLINTKNKGLKNVFVWLVSDNPIPIHPALMKFPPTVEIDQPDCMFFPRAIGMREGQVFKVKNSAPVQHNIRWIGDGVNNQGGNVTLKQGDSAEVKDLKAQRLPLPLECNIHGWMKGRLGVFAHPYFAITDENGNFEIPNAPVGEFRVMIYHEEIGYRGGAKNKNGEPITIKGKVTDLGTLQMGGK